MLKPAPRALATQLWALKHEAPDAKGVTELLHLAGSTERGVSGWEGGHHLIADGLDDSATVGLGGGAHHVDTGGDHVARPQVAHDFKQAR